MDKWIAGKVTEVKHWTDKLYSLKLNAPVAPFLAGQFTRLALDIDGERIARPYSYVNTPHEQELEFYFNRVQKGTLSSKLSLLKTGEQVWVYAKAGGRLTLAEVPVSKHLWMLSTGTAIGPFLSMLKTDEPWQNFQRIILVQGMRSSEDLTYQETIQQFCSQYPEKFTVVYSYTREGNDVGITGRIPNAIKTGQLEALVGINLNVKLSQIMVCGNAGMIKDTQDVLNQRGFRKNSRKNPGHITVENYG